MFIQVHDKYTNKVLTLNTEFIIKIYTDNDNDTHIDFANGRCDIITSETRQEINNALFMLGLITQ